MCEPLQALLGVHRFMLVYDCYKERSRLVLGLRAGPVGRYCRNMKDNGAIWKLPKIAGRRFNIKPKRVGLLA